MELRTVGEITEESRAEYSKIRNFRKGCKSYGPRRICYTIEVRGILSTQQIWDRTFYLKFQLLISTEGKGCYRGPIEEKKRAGKCNEETYAEKWKEKRKSFESIQTLNIMSRAT